MIAINDLAYMAGVLVQTIPITTKNYLQQLHRLIQSSVENRMFQSRLDSQPICKEGK